MRKIRVYDINYDFGGDSRSWDDMQEELILDIEDDPEFDPESDLADMVSDTTGWCVIDLKYEWLEDNPNIEVPAVIEEQPAEPEAIFKRKE